MNPQDPQNQGQSPTTPNTTPAGQDTTSWPQPTEPVMPAPEPQQSQSPQYVVEEAQPEETQPNVENVPENPEPPKTTNWLAILLTVLLIFALGGIGYFAFQNFQLKQQLSELESQSMPTYVPTEIPTPSPTPDPTANWKTYTNTQYHFSFKYPESLILEDKSVPGIAQVLLVAQAFRETKISANKNDLSNLYLDTASVGKTTIGNLSGNKYYLPQGYCDGPNCSSPILAVSVVNNNIKYVFSVFVEKGSSNFTDLENQILSTFKFLEASPSASPSASPTPTPTP